MPQETEVLSDLIGHIYDAALDRALWSDALRRSCEFVGGSASSLYWKDVAKRIGNRAFHWNSRSDVPERNYFREYVGIDPFSPGQFLFDIGEVYSVGDCIPYDEFLQTRAYKEWAKPQGWVDHLATTLDKAATGFSLFGIYRNEEQGLADEEMRRRMRLLVPHVRRATLIGNVFDLKAAEAASLADTLDGLAAAVFLVDESARIVFANASGQIMLDEGKILRSKNNLLTNGDQRAGTALLEVVALARGGDAAIGVSGIAVPLSLSPGEPWLAHVLPLTSGRRQNAGAAYSAVAAVFVRKAALEIPSAIETISKRYGLTPGELRVLAVVSEVGGIPSVADVLGISEATVKTHLQHLFAKTGTKRQTELVRLITEHASPLGR